MDAMTGSEKPGLGSGALREALEAVINERDTELDMMHCQWGSREYQIAWHDGVEQARKRFDIVKKRAAEALALSLSSPIEPAYTLDDKLRALHEDNVNISQMLVMLAKDVHGLARPIPQASSEIREAADAIATCLDALNEQNIGLMKAAIRHQLTLLAPSRQGAAKRLEG